MLNLIRLIRILVRMWSWWKLEIIQEILFQAADIHIEKKNWRKRRILRNMKTHKINVLVETMYSTSFVQGLRKQNNLDLNLRKEPFLARNLYTFVSTFSFFNKTVQRRQIQDRERQETESKINTSEGGSTSNIWNRKGTSVNRKKWLIRIVGFTVC